jgi:hypothetical protein
VEKCTVAYRGAEEKDPIAHSFEAENYREIFPKAVEEQPAGMGIVMGRRWSEPQ